MSYQAPYIDEAGLHLSSYNDIRDKLIEEMKQIYGQDIYLEKDSQDYQMISAFALMIYDTQQSLLLAYNNNSPATASGTGLDRVVALNGIHRTKASYSSCVVQLKGAPLTKINGGMVADSRGYQWALPELVTLGAAGTAQVTAVCKEVGRITASPGDIDTIVTPTKGWTAVTNQVSAVPGVNQEGDSALRYKQSVSVANPSRSVFEGTIGAIANAEGVVRHVAYENDTGVTVNGLPPHSITLVIEGGADEELANLIYRHKTPGCYTHGDVCVTIQGAYGVTTPIRFFRPQYIDVVVKITVVPLEGYTDAVTDNIQEKIYDYINSRAIGESVYTSNLNMPVLQALGQPPNFYVAGLTAGKAGGAAGEVIQVGLFEAVRTSREGITIEVKTND